MTPNPNLPSPAPNQRTTPWHPAPALPPHDPGKKPDKKLETPVLVAMISAVVTLVTAFMGSPLLLNLLNKTGTPEPTSAAELVAFYNSTLPSSVAGAGSFKATFTPVEQSITILEFTSTSQAETPTSAAPPREPTFTPAALTPKNPDPATPAAASFFRCVTVDLWFPYPSTLNPGSSRGCWNLADWGFATGQGGLMLVHNPGQDQERGIYTPISGNTDIRFSLQLNEFRTHSNKVAFLNFGIVQNEPISIYTGGYLSYQQSAPGPASPVTVLISGSKQATQKISVLEDGFQHQVLLSIKDDLMTVYLNDELTGNAVKLPHTDRAFWIGYVLPSKAELDVMVSNMTIQTR